MHTLLEAHVTPHGARQGASVGTVVLIWLSQILAARTHCLAPVRGRGQAQSIPEHASFRNLSRYSPCQEKKFARWYAGSHGEASRRANGSDSIWDADERVAARDRLAGEGGATAEPVIPAAPMTCAHAISVLDTIPGVDQVGWEMLVAKRGIDMARCGTADCLAVWSGVAPGNNDSAGEQ